MASYRAPAAETRGFSFRRDANNQHIPPVRDESRSNTEQKISFSSKEASIRPAMSNDKPSNVTEGHIRNQARPSALPRSTSSSSQARLSYIASTRPMPSFAGKSPPLQAMRLPPNAANSLQIDTSGSSITQKARQDSLKQTASPLDMDDDTVLGIVMPEKPSTYPPATLPPRLIPELQALAASTNGPLNIPSSSISTISSPSTQFTASSSPWSASTAATTPISWSSASPSVVQTVYGSSKRSHTVPMPANVRTKIPKMPTLKERNASAAASKATVVSESERTGRKLRKTNNPELNPPPRSSSLKGNRSRSNSGATIKSDKQSAPEISIPKFPVPPVSSSAPALQINTQPEPTGRRQNPQISQGHTRLQEALNTAQRPRGQRTAAYESSAQSLHDEHTSPRPRQLLEPLPVVQNQHRRLPSLSRRHHRQASTSEPESEKQSARSRLAKFSKLALFGRSKNSAEPEQKPQKLLSRKGPAAGTGHEGYGKFGRRLRKYSVSSSIAATESDTSLASISSRRPTERRQSRVSNISQEQSDLDEFAAPRMKPRIMMGGSQRGQIDSFQMMSKNPQMSDVSLSTMSSADSFPAYTRLASPRRERFPPEDEDTPPTLMTRRSQRLADSDEPFSFPGPIETQSLATTPCLDSRNTTQSSDLPTPGSTMYKIDPNLLEKQRNKSKRLRWNIFKRKDSISDAEKPVIRASSRSGVSVDVTPGPMHRPVPYYAMLGSESEDNTTASIGQYLREAAESPEKENDQEEMISVGFSDNEIMENPYVNRESILLPSAPIREFRQPPTAVSYDTPISGYGSSSQNEAPEESAPGRRQPRLARVGRIPQVVSTRQQPQSAIPVQQQLRAHTRERLRRQASSERLPRLRTGDQPQVPSHMWSNLSRPEVEPSVQSSASQRPPITGEREFLRYAEVRNSDFTTSSESTGIISIAGPPLSQVPSLSKHPVDYFSHEDEVWNEYDDFMDDIMSPASSIKSPQKQKKDKRTASRKELRQQSSGKDVAKAKGLAITPAALHGTSSSKQFLDTPPLAPSNVTSSQELEPPSEAEIRLRRSRIAAALHASYAPSSPFSMREFIDEYGRRGSGKYSERLSGSSAQASTPIMAIAQPQPPQPPQPQREQSRPLQYENAAQLEEIERTKDPAKHSDRAYASLMVSRWLSFGRVLFSPAHKEIENNPEKHVLVIDGLGSEDWSIYCAVTYQNERAYVHDLKERRQRKPKAQSAQTVESAPSNHRRSEVSSFNDKFPFPPDFFCAIVIRFPPAMPDSKLKNIVSECRRVLAPGGYLELVVLDLDIVNMGVQTRRAIKELKIKLTAADKTVSLKPIIDNVQTVLGSNGFSNLSRCVVGVPVVGKPAASLDSSSESRSSKGSTDLQEKRVPAGPRPYGSLGSQANFSLNDLVADHSENADAKIGKMVSRTARSWWQHCFEAGIMMKGGKSKSVFANKEVLAECKSRGASFKLLIAYTQKPANPQRERSMSEPTVATLVTAGARTLRNQR